MFIFNKCVRKSYLCLYRCFCTFFLAFFALLPQRNSLIQVCNGHVDSSLQIQCKREAVLVVEVGLQSKERRKGKTQV